MTSWLDDNDNTVKENAPEEQEKLDKSNKDTTFNNEKINDMEIDDLPVEMGRDSPDLETITTEVNTILSENSSSENIETLTVDAGGDDALKDIVLDQGVEKQRRNPRRNRRLPAKYADFTQWMYTQ